MNYQQTIDYLYSRLPMFHRIGPAAYKADLSNTWALADFLGNPHLKFKSIHIAGTNGKGSVASMLASIFQEAGYKTGLCTSPHLRDFRERFRINGEMIDKEFIVDFVENVSGFSEKINPSFFELTIAMTFDYFARQKVDIAIIETGLGGRLDSTNIIRPELSIITNIGFDHTNLLGNTIEKIAFEKAGIIKQGVPLVIGKTRSEALKVILGKANELDALSVYADSLYRASEPVLNSLGDEMLLCFQLEGKNKSRYIPGGLTGLCQLDNMITTMASIETINAAKNFCISERALLDGIRNVVKNTGLTGRWQVLAREPLVICDTGHNADGVRSVLDNIAATPHHKLHFVLGLMNDKNMEELLSLLPVENTRYYFCRPDVPRGLNEKTLQDCANKKGLDGAAYKSVRQALDHACSKANKNDLVFIGGSTFVVAEVV